MRGDRVGRAASARVGRHEYRAAIVIDLRDQTVGRGTRIAGERATLEHVPYVVSQSRIDAAPDHVRGKQRDIAGAAGQDVFGTAFERSHQRMYAHLADDCALTQGQFAQVRADASAQQLAVLELADDSRRVQFGADDGNPGITYVE